MYATIVFLIGAAAGAYAWARFGSVVKGWIGFVETDLAKAKSVVETVKTDISK